MNRHFRGWLLGLLVVACLLALLSVFNSNRVGAVSRPRTLTVSELLADLKENKIESGRWEGTTVKGKLATGVEYECLVPDYNAPSAAPLLVAFQNSNANLSFEKPPAINSAATMLSYLAFPLMVLAIIYFLILRPAQLRGYGRPGYVTYMPGQFGAMSAAEAANQEEIARLTRIIADLTNENMRLRKQLGGL